jgi:hypothetical protein
VVFVFGFPFVIIFILFKNRHHLQSPHNRRRLGFIYKPFIRGAEFWELHEVFRKMILTSLLIFIPEISRTAVAILICVIAIASLNYVRPHKNSIVFWVAETSFILTTFKYLASILIVTQKAAGEYSKSKNSLGWVLIGLDFTMMFGSVVAALSILILLKRTTKPIIETESEHKSSTKTPLTNVIPDNRLTSNSRWNLTQNDLRKAAHHAKVEKTEIDAAKAHDAAVHEIELQKSHAQQRLQARLRKRNSINPATNVKQSKVRGKTGASSKRGTESKLMPPPNIADELQMIAENAGR